MKFSFFKRARQQQELPTFRTFSQDGVRIHRGRVALDAATASAASTLETEDTSLLLEQLEEEGFATTDGDGALIPWDQLYALLECADHASSLSILRLPPVAKVAPVLKSHDSLTDANFAITVDGWIDGDGHYLGSLPLSGAAIRLPAGHALLGKTAWEVLQAVAAFHRRPAAARNDADHRRAWGQIRRKALAAHARLDDFLYRSVVLTPEKLDIGLRRGDIGTTKVVEIVPDFAGAPPNWLEVFDRQGDVSDRYDIPTAEGIAQVLVTPQVKTVLTQIKRLAQRRVAGSRAEAFVVNPFAALGEDAAAVIDPDRFEKARADAGLLFDRFTASISFDAAGYPESVGIRIESAMDAETASGGFHAFGDDRELEQFINAVERNLDRNLQLCAWKMYEFELLGNTRDELDKLRKALAQRQAPRILISQASVYDLSRYCSRVEDIGVEKPYYSPAIARKTDEEGWFPENILPVIVCSPEGASAPVAIPVTPLVQDQIETGLAEAKAAGKDSFSLAGFPAPLKVQEAEMILQTFSAAMADVKADRFEPDTSGGKKDAPRKSLVVKANIAGIDYEEARRDVLSAFPATPALPASLRPGVALLDHQQAGVARLQHLFAKSPEHCRGVVLADDMGLGKTLQLLAVIACAFERNPHLEPALVVAPVSLLENWQEEVGKFFKDGSLPILTVYGDAARKIRVPRESIDAQLKSDGLVKFLVPGWRGDARLVLTTYETLRDLEFSFAEESWSIMVCDEAQRIKNPNAMVTRAAKKQNVRFKVACTGTPVENTLADLWCLFDFVQPGLLGALNSFSHRYRKPIEAKTEKEKERVVELRQRIAPQVIRRTKAEVATNLMPKRELECRIPISAFQRSLYANSLAAFRHRQDEPDADGPFGNALSLLHYLRLICTDPNGHGVEARLVPLEDYRVKAPKLSWLMEKLTEIRRRDEKVIVFCEFRAIQRLLKHYIGQAFGISPDIINGDTTASTTASDSRQKRIRAFQDKAGFGVLILSPVAVGFGVNIQAANHVIHYTRTWNPAKEDQATDRAYRIGQTKEVHVYYPVAFADDFTTFDVKLHRLLEYKRELAKDMLNGSGDVRPGEFNVLEMVPKTSNKL